MNTLPNGLPPPQAAVPPGEWDEHARSRLLRAAVQVFNKKGYSAASVREIVELANVTKPALYYHFGSKEGVLQAILHEGLEEFRATAAKAIEMPGTTRERLTRLCEDLFGLFMENVPVIQVVHRAFHDPAGNPPTSTSSRSNVPWARPCRQSSKRGWRQGSCDRSAPTTWPSRSLA